MGLRCLLGHNFGEPELQREREEDGNEVVTTVTEVKTCARCGETQIVSENTEVTTMEQLAEEAAIGTAQASSAADAGETPAPNSATDGTTEPGPAESGRAVDPADRDVTEEDAILIDDGTADAGVDKGPGAETTSEAEREADASVEDEGAELLDEGAEDGNDSSPGDNDGYAASPETGSAETPQSDDVSDDGVILDEEGEDDDGDRDRGAWPAVDEAQSPGEESTPWPEQRGEDEGFSAEIDNGDADGSVEFGGGLTPETAETAADEDVEYVAAPDPSGASGTGGTDRAAADEGAPITRSASPDLGTSSDNMTTEYYCPECEMTRAADGNSMRAGDICPECKRGYVDERPI